VKEDDRPRTEPGRLTAQVGECPDRFPSNRDTVTPLGASALLRHQWQGHEQLSEYLRRSAHTGLSLTLIDSLTCQVYRLQPQKDEFCFVMRPCSIAGSGWNLFIFLLRIRNKKSDMNPLASPVAMWQYVARLPTQ